jgi:hypothetical protein
VSASERKQKAEELLARTKVRAFALIDAGMDVGSFTVHMHQGEAVRTEVGFSDSSGTSGTEAVRIAK